MVAHHAGDQLDGSRTGCYPNSMNCVEWHTNVAFGGASSNRVKDLCEEGDVHCVHKLSCQIYTNVVAWDDQMDLGSLVHKFWEFLNRAPENATPAEFTITADGASSCGVPKSSRAVREKENECVIGIPKCSSFRDQTAQLESCEFQVGAMIEELVVHHEQVLNLVLDKLGDKTKSHMVPETLCAILRLRMKEDVGPIQLAKMAVVVKGEKSLLDPRHAEEWH